MTQLFKVIKEYDDTQLLHYLHEEIENKGNQEELMQMMTWNNTDSEDQDQDAEFIQCSSLQFALYDHKSNQVIFKMMDVGGRELIMKENPRKYTALHDICGSKNPSLDIITKLIEMGGKELVMLSNNQLGESALHIACQNKIPSMDVISKLIKIGGRELVMMKTKLKSILYCIT